eukprot:6654406-Prymnesium_polylepis.3
MARNHGSQEPHVTAVDREWPPSCRGGSPSSALFRVGTAVRFDAAVGELQMASFDRERANEAYVGDVHLRRPGPQRQQGLRSDHGAD